MDKNSQWEIQVRILYEIEVKCDRGNYPIALPHVANSGSNYPIELIEDMLSLV
jgi:hypothetical protein